MVAVVTQVGVLDAAVGDRVPGLEELLLGEDLLPLLLEELVVGALEALVEQVDQAHRVARAGLELLAVLA